MELERGERALDTLQHASPELAETWLWRANALTQVARCEDAIESVQQGLMIEPENSYLHQALARSRLMLNHLGEAEAAVLESLRLNPDEPEALATHALILNSRGNRQEATRVIHRAAELAPELRSVRLIRAMLTAPRDDEAAIRISRELLAAEPAGAAEHWLHATNLVRRGRLRDAADHFTRAAALDPGNSMFTGAARVSRHWSFWPLRVTSPILFWLAWYSIFPLLLFAVQFGGVLWTALWCAVAWAAYSIVYLLAHRFAGTRALK
jgi:Flp pilus assembly protein TadD